MGSYISNFVELLCVQRHEPEIFYIFRIIGALSLMSTLFIGVAIMAKIDSDKWQGGGFLITIITLKYSNFEIQSFRKDLYATGTGGAVCKGATPSVEQ